MGVWKIRVLIKTVDSKGQAHEGSEGKKRFYWELARRLFMLHPGKEFGHVLSLF